MVVMLGLELPLWVVLSTGAAVLLGLYVYMSPDLYKNSELPGPKSVPLFGTILKYAGRSVPEYDRELREKYGKMVLLYDGMTPNILIFDPEFVRCCIVKHFDKLSNRRILIGGGSIESGILNTGGEHWKHVRSLISQSFSTGKLKRMFPKIQNCCKNLRSVLKEKNGEPVKLRELMSAFTLEVIGATAFGLDVDCQRNPDNEFLIHARAFVGQLEKQETVKDKIFGVIFLLCFMVAPKLISRLLKLTGSTIFDRNAVTYFDALCEKMIEDSKGESGEDFITSVSNLIGDTSPNNPYTLYDKKGLAWSKNGLSKEDVMGNAILFLFAGYQTTADTSHYLFYELAVNQEIQKKARAEILEICNTEEVTYEQISKLEYSEWCLHEAMRLHPVGFRWDREVSEDFEYEGLMLKKGTILTISTVGIHNNPEFWEEPIQFKPERWSPENSEGRHPCAFLPFGYGPRQCIGLRLALMELKIALIYVMKNFEIRPTAATTTEKPLRLLQNFTILPEVPLEVSFIPLNSR